LPKIDIASVATRTGAGYPRPVRRSMRGLQGELKLVEGDESVPLRAGECAAFPKGTGNGHHPIDETDAVAVYLEIGSRHPDDLTPCSDIDMMSSNADGRFVHKDGLPYP